MSKPSAAGENLVKARDTARPRRKAAPAAPAEAVVAQLELVQREVDSLKGELNSLRRRDETLNFYMHRLDEELRLAARLQQDFLPKMLPQLGPVHFHTLFRPAGYVSGDLYDVMRLDEHRIGFYIADAVGHGMPAALLTMFIKHALVTKEIAGNEYRLLSPSEALSRLNTALIDQNLSQAAFATALYGVVDVQNLEVTLARAGHPNPLLLRDDGLSETIECEGPLLGIFPNESFSDVRVTLRSGDRLLLYTDGIEVAFCDDHSLDTQHWREELQLRSELPTGRLLHEFAERIDSESGSLEPKDDLTMVILEVKPQTADQVERVSDSR
ncbi:MAG TPA: PP2C family protein-serine/threonine phosphatase [Tepidisphaeraceae bacterium]|jgi:sigma-B regulation protein RsbU (phosphoserine phosphatase)|nr:PP2C family protein-serine/threonine phosphatase [Tepidisphaeraceae bacterium]